MGTAVKVLWGPASLADWTISSDANYDLDDADDKVAVAFAVPWDGTIEKVGFYIDVFNGAPPDYKVTIETLAADGQPSGADYGGSAFGGFTPAGVGWLWVALGTNATVAAGDLVAAVVGPQVVAPTPADSIDIGVRTLGLESGSPAYKQFSTAWATVSGRPPIAVQYDDGTVYGLAAISCEGETFDIADTPDEMGCKFTVPADMVCYGARVGFNSALANASWEVRLYNAADAVIASMTIDDEDKALRDENWHDAFWDEVSLTAEAVYRLTVRATHATAIIKPGRITFPDADSRDAMPEGPRWTGTERTDLGAWTDTALEQGYMAIWVNDITFAGGGGGAEPMAGLLVG